MPARSSTATPVPRPDTALVRRARPLVSDRLFAAFDIGLVFALALGLALWQLIVVRRSIAKDRDAATRRPPDEPAA